MPDGSPSPPRRSTEVTLAVVWNDIIHLRADLVDIKANVSEALLQIKADVGKFVECYERDTKARADEMKLLTGRVDRIEAAVNVGKWLFGALTAVVLALLIQWLSKLV